MVMDRRISRESVLRRYSSSCEDLSHCVCCHAAAAVHHWFHLCDSEGEGVLEDQEMQTIKSTLRLSLWRDETEYFRRPTQFQRERNIIYLIYWWKHNCGNFFKRHKIRTNKYILMQFLTEMNIRGSNTASTCNRLHTQLWLQLHIFHYGYI